MRDDQRDEPVPRRLIDLNVGARITVRTETGSYVTGTVTQVVRETGGLRLRLDDCHTDIPQQMQYLGDPESIVVEFDDLEVVPASSLRAVTTLSTASEMLRRAENGARFTDTSASFSTICAKSPPTTWSSITGAILRTG